MNKYFWLATIFGLIAWSGFMYYEGLSKEKAVCGQADAKHDLAQSNITVAAEKGVIATIGQQQSITQEVDHAYLLKKNSIDDLYRTNFDSVQPKGVAASNSMPNTAHPTSRPNVTTSRPFRTSVFGLSAQECDENTEQLYGLQEWVSKQQAVKQPGTR